MLAITLGLGLWQVHRLSWKRALLAEIEQGEAAGPVPLDGAPQPFRRVIATGRFQPLEARYGVELRSPPGSGPVLGAHVLNALTTAQGVSVIVDRGWAPMDAEVKPPDGDVRVEGYIRPADRQVWFGPKDDIAGRRFYTLDPVVIGEALSVSPVAPFTLIELGRPGNGLPEPATALPRPPNDHLSYAITWFGLSAALLLVFGVYARQAIQQGRDP